MFASAVGGFPFVNLLLFFSNGLRAFTEVPSGLLTLYFASYLSGFCPRKADDGQERGETALERWLEKLTEVSSHEQNVFTKPFAKKFQIKHTRSGPD